MSRTLILEDGHTRRQLLLTGTLTVGRDPACDINHGDPRLSRRHAELRLTPDGIVVADLHSRNGVWVNGKPVGEALIHPGDVIQIAHLTFRFDDEPPLSTPAAAQPTQAVEAPAADGDDERTRMIPPPQEALSGVRITPGVEDDRTRLSHGPPSGARPRSGIISQTTVPDLGDMLLRADVVRAPALEPIREAGVRTILTSGWGWRAMATGAALALFVAVGTALPLVALEGPEMRAAALRAWPMWAPALAGPALLGALGALVIARAVVRGYSTRQQPK
jgi:pSer/pThr/pTyr-binding forkhead associated (FHA) protein